MDKKTEAQRGALIYLRSHSLSKLKLNPETSLFNTTRYCFSWSSTLNSVVSGTQEELSECLLNKWVNERMNPPKKGLRGPINLFSGRVVDF